MSERRALGLEHLIQPLADGRANKRRFIAMLWCYLDDSGTDRDSPTVTLAGYVARYDAWTEFERRTRRAFRPYKIEHFHAKEFHDGDAPFKGWSVAKQMAFANDWFEAATSSPVQLGITVSMPKAKFNTHRREHGVKKNTSAYGHCFEEILNHLLSDNDVGAAIIDHGISFFVEAGSGGNAGMLNIFNKRRKHDAAPYLQQMSFVDKRSCKAIQFADYLAFYSRRLANRYEVGASAEMPSFLVLAKEKVRTIGLLAESFHMLPKGDR